MDLDAILEAELEKSNGIIKPEFFLDKIKYIEIFGKQMRYYAGGTYYWFEAQKEGLKLILTIAPNTFYGKRI